MIKLLLSATLAAGIAAAPAAAATYDAFTSFDGTQGAGGFTYGTYDGTAFTAFTGDTGCSNKISNVVCLGDLPGVFKTTSGAHQSGTVIVPDDALILHPGPDAGQTSALYFVTPHAGTYRITATAFVADNNPSGVKLFGFTQFGRFDFATLDAAHPTFTFTETDPFPGAYTLGFGVDYDGSYNNDSTGVNFTVTSVPEPATWSLMIAGFALTGFGARRRRALAACHLRLVTEGARSGGRPRPHSF